MEGGGGYKLGKLWENCGYKTCGYKTCCATSREITVIW